MLRRDGLREIIEFNNKRVRFFHSDRRLNATADFSLRVCKANVGEKKSEEGGIIG